jgi:hypothetical protein
MMNDQSRYASARDGVAEPTAAAESQAPDTPVFSLRREIYYRVHYFMNAYPWLYMPLVRYRHRFSVDRVVDHDTDLVIEAFGRSGTTFANLAFLSVQRRRVRTVHHTHAAAQVLTAVKMKIPTLVIVRQPEAVALSHMVRHGISARPALVAWLRFHERLVSSGKAIVFCSFDQLTHNFTPVIQRLNESFGTCFDIWQHSKANEAEIFEQIQARNRGRFRADAEVERRRAFALPTAEREALKRRLSVQLQAHSLTALRNRANRLYQSLVD